MLLPLFLFSILLSVQGSPLQDFWPTIQDQLDTDFDVFAAQMGQLIQSNNGSFDLSESLRSQYTVLQSEWKSLLEHHLSLFDSQGDTAQIQLFQSRMHKDIEKSTIRWKQARLGKWLSRVSRAWIGLEDQIARRLQVIKSAFGGDSCQIPRKGKRHNFPVGIAVTSALVGTIVGGFAVMQSTLFLAAMDRFLDSVIKKIIGYNDEKDVSNNADGHE